MQRISVMHVKDSNGIYGAERVILALGKNLNKKIFNVTVLCMKGRDGGWKNFAALAKKVGIQVIGVSMKRGMDLRALLEIRKAIIVNSVSIVHSHDFKSDLYVALASANLGIRTVATAHGSTRDSILKRFYLLCNERMVYRFFDRIIVVSKDLEGKLRRKNVIPSRLRIIQNGLDIDSAQGDRDEENAKQPLYFPAGRKVFAVIGRLYPDKGHRFFLQAFSNVCRENKEILGLIVGDGPERNTIERQVKELKLVDSVLLCGARWDMKRIYERIDFLVIPSLTEGLPYVLLEAMMNRVPVLATAVGDIPLAVDHGLTGYLVEPGDVNGLEKGILELLRYPENAWQMAANGYRVVKDRFSAERMVRDTERLYMELVSEKEKDWGGFCDEA
jgi:glycosyltransferase involved in cell wall biosynthesis